MLEEARENQAQLNSGAERTRIQKYIWQVYEDHSEQKNAPSPRFHHFMILYKNKIVVFGGSTAQETQIQTLAVVYIFDIDQKQWHKYTTFLTPESMKHFRLQNALTVGNRILILGELQKDGNKSLAIYRLSLDSMEWVQFQQKGQIPKPAQGACLGIFEKWLIYFGGYFHNTFFNRICLYNPDTRIWYVCKGDYQFALKARYACSLAYLNQQLYLFGGLSKSLQGLQALNDFYLINIRLPYKTSPPYVTLTKINTLTSPPPRGQHLMFPINSSDICMLGGERKDEFDDSIWIFSTQSQEWSQFGTFQQKIFNRQGFSYVQESNNTWIFGGLDPQFSGNYRKNIKNDLLKLTLNLTQLYSPQVDQKMSPKTTFDQGCVLCYQHKFDFVFKDLSFSGDLIDQMCQMLDFPFAAFGLLTDNSVSLSAEKIAIIVGLQKGSHWVKIEDNGKNIWTANELIQSLLIFGYQNSIVLTGSDKKIKKSILRTNSLREYGVNIKLGCLRVGKRLLFVTHCSNNKILICTIYKSKSQDKSCYEMRYYVFDAHTRQMVDQNMRPNRHYIDGIYQKYIKSSLQKPIRNTIFIFDTIFDENTQNLNISWQSGDIFLGPPQQLQRLTSMGYNLSECVDTSLKAYLSSLYLRNESCDITLVVGRNVNSILSQGFLEKVDRMNKMGAIVEMSDVLDFDFKLAELYYLKELRKNISFFSNGILLYCRNRLVNRYRPKLGTLLNSILTETSAFVNYLPMFGYAQLPQNIPLDHFKMNFSFDLLVEKLYSRLKFVEVSFKNKVSTSVVVQAHLEALQRRQKVFQSVAPIKQLPRRQRGHYGQRNWDQLADRFQLQLPKRRTTPKKANQQQKSIQIEKKCEGYRMSKQQQQQQDYSPSK